MCAFWSLGTWDSHVAVKGGGGFPGSQGSFTWNSHVRKAKPLVYRHLYMEFPCKEGEALVFRFLYMAFPCQNEVTGQVYMAISM